MAERTYKNLRQELLELYQAKEYTWAYDLVEREQANFPSDARDIAYWRISLNALLGKQREALRIIRESLVQGDWFPPIWMGREPDLVSLQPMPEFQEMIELCRQRLAQMQSEAHPELLVQQPADQTGALPLLIALHGNGNNMNTTVEHWSGITTHGWLLAVPQSSQVVGPDAFVWDERESGINEVREHLAALNNEYHIDPERVVLGGFSRGGGQAIWMALHQSIKTCGFVVLGPYLPEAELAVLPHLLETQAPAGLHGAILVGEEDTECLAISRKVVEIMCAHDLPCQLEVRSGLDHNYPADPAAWVAKELRFIEPA